MMMCLRDEIILQGKTEAGFYEGGKKGFPAVIEMNLLLPPAGSWMARHFSALCVVPRHFYIS